MNQHLKALADKDLPQRRRRVVPRKPGAAERDHPHTSSVM